MEHSYSNITDSLAKEVSHFEKKFEFEIEQNSAKKLAKYEEFYSKLLELSPDKTRLMIAKDRIKELRQNHNQWFQNLILAKL